MASDAGGHNLSLSPAQASLGGALQTGREAFLMKKERRDARGSAECSPEWISCLGGGGLDSEREEKLSRKKVVPQKRGGAT